VRVRANEIPLPAAEVTQLGYQINALFELSNLNLEPTIVSPAHLGSDQPRSDFVPGVTVSPHNSDRPRKCPEANKPPPCKSI
jgi:hypothetical protein